MARSFAMEVFGELVFGRNRMKEMLPPEAYERFLKVVDEGERMDQRLAEVVANAMREWAVSKGATHYTHWFHPRTEATAEKHNAFLKLDLFGNPVESFSGDELVQGEPDASSFPSGGIRTTFEARGYTAWDPTSPAFLMEGEKGKILCIPSVFISYNGEVLDTKTPLLRALSALERAAMRLLKLFGNRTVKWVRMTVGPEQEYFLIDRSHLRRRLDLAICGRTLMGAMPPKGQQMEDHYFGSIRPQVLSFMEEVEERLWRLGIAARTRHNEVAPGQFELAPWHAEANLASDQNHLSMEVMRKVAESRGLAVLFHEKPFAGLNGSGKHTNFSLVDSEGRNLLSPSSNPRRNLQFLALICTLLEAVNSYGDLWRASVASYGNMFRLGGNEAPPAIISVYLGHVLSSVLDNVESSYDRDIKKGGWMELGVDRLPAIVRDNTDRNRTAPVAFTGNKFEYRAVGAPASLGTPLKALAISWAKAIDEMASRIEAKMASGMEVEEASISAMKEVLERTHRVRFEGNCYDPAWHAEAARRGLPIARTTPEALSYYLAEKNLRLFEESGVLSRREVWAFHHIKLEQYCKTMAIEVDVLSRMVREGVLPALMRQVRLERDALEALEGLGSFDALRSSLSRVGDLAESLLLKLSELEGALRRSLCEEDVERRAHLMTEEVLPAMEGVRALCDASELLVAEDVWPFPRYREMLFGVGRDS